MIYVCVVSLYEVRYLPMGLHQMKISYSSWRMTSCGDRHQGEMCKTKTKRSFLKRSYAWCLQWIHEDEAKRDSPIVSMGEYLEKSSSSMCLDAQSRKDDPLEEIKIVIIQLKCNAQGKGMILIGL